MKNYTDRSLQDLEQDRINLDRLKKQFGSFKNIGLRVGFTEKTANQNITNWYARGIPYRTKVRYPELFMPHIVGQSQDEQSSKK